MQRTLEIMKHRQRAMSRSLLAIRTMARVSLRSGQPPDFGQLGRLVAYLERFAQGRHQPAEEQHLFRALARREPAASRSIARAKRDHAACLGYFNRLNSAFTRWRGGQPAAGGELALMADDYARFCHLHARIEARDVLSVANRALQAGDWSAIAEALAAANDPLDRCRTGAECAAALRAAF
jgi:hemerythrin-like domain-containing protein